MSEDVKVNRERMIELLNEDLSREYQAIIAYTIYSQTIKGAAFNNIASELEGHAVPSHVIRGSFLTLITTEVSGRNLGFEWV